MESRRARLADPLAVRDDRRRAAPLARRRGGGRHDPKPDKSGAIFAGEPVDLLKLLLTCLVPYCVTTYGAVAFRLDAARRARHPRIKTHKEPNYG